jgi:phosphoglycolate phosphatase
MSAIIFDFDGTIADSFDLVLDLFYELTGIRQFSEAEIVELKKLSLRNAAKIIHLSPRQLPFLLIKGRTRMGRRLNEISPFPGIDKALKQLKDEGHRLFIISSNSGHNVTTFLETHRLADNFEEIYGGVGLLGKASVLRKVMHRKKLAPEDTYYVGDEARDIIAAKHAHVYSLAVSWGYNDVSLLEKEQPYRILKKPKDILSLFH